MSEIRMCDTCGVIFPLNTNGWEEFTRVITPARFNNRNGEVIAPQNAIHMHVCPQCALGQIESITPRIALPPNRSVTE